MAYTKTHRKSNTNDIARRELTTQRESLTVQPDVDLFYELEAAVVIDVIRDENHPVFTQNPNPPKTETSNWPKKYTSATNPDLDYSWIGRIKVRLINSQQQLPIENLDWVTPMETNLFEYPLVNEVVVVSQYMGRLFYSRRLNSRNFINNSADFQHEWRFGKLQGVNDKTSPGSLLKARNESDLWPQTNKYGEASGGRYLGRYFKVNNKIRPLKHFEGDTILQSRHGSSIRFGCYEDDPKIDIGTSLGYGESYEDNLGNPMILIRNRQKKTNKDEQKFQYNILENVNEDGSSIQITSGRTVSKFVPTINHTYDNVNYPRRGCVHKTFNGLETLRKSKVGIGNNYTRQDTATRLARPAGERIN